MPKWVATHSPSSSRIRPTPRVRSASSVTVTDDALAARGVGSILDDLSDCVHECFGIDHATFQVEPESHQEHEPGDVHR